MERKCCRKRHGIYVKMFAVLAIILVGIFAVIKGGSAGVPVFTEIRSIFFEGPMSLSVDITAANACVVDADTGAILLDKSCWDETAPASTAKLLTALTVLEYCPPEQAFTVGSELELVAEDASRAWLNQGDTLTLRQLLVALLLPSGNDAAYTLAVNTGRMIAGDGGLTDRQSVDVFMEAANEKCRELGAIRSNFVAPDGYDAEGQYTTAYDMALIAGACLDNSIISEIVSSFRISDTWLSGREVTYYNSNKLLDPDSEFYYPEAVGMKTGYSSSAGACLISAAEIGGKTYICVVMGSTEEGRFQDSVKIYHEIKKMAERK